jgi:uncharacterized membrane protein YobD (UPF0266 family)
MKSNMSSTDRIGRVIFAVLVVLLYFMEIISGGVATTLLVVGVVFVVTSAIGFCPMYTLFGMNTNKGNS